MSTKKPFWAYPAAIALIVFLTLTTSKPAQHHESGMHNVG